MKKLEKDARNARGDGRGGEMLSAIRKMAKSPAVGKRLAAACHVAIPTKPRQGLIWSQPSAFDWYKI